MFVDIVYVGKRPNIGWYFEILFCAHKYIIGSAANCCTLFQTCSEFKESTYSPFFKQVIMNLILISCVPKIFG
jgi:hypothetical protein